MKVPVPDGSLHVESFGEGAPILLVHGFPFSHAMWRPVALRLAKAGHRALVPDLRGFGASTGSPAAGVATYARDLVAVLDAAGARGAVPWVGFSMGGYVALEGWRAHRARIRALALVDTRAAPDDEAGQAGRRKTAAAVEAGGSVVVADGMLPKLFAAATAPGLRAEVHAAMKTAPRSGVVAGLLAMASRPDSVPTLRTIDVPTLVLVGEEDAITPPRDAEAMARTIRGARLELVARAGHLAPLERPDEVATALDAWLRGLR